MAPHTARAYLHETQLKKQKHVPKQATAKKGGDIQTLFKRIENRNDERNEKKDEDTNTMYYY